MNKLSPTFRGDLMRQIAALHIQADRARTTEKRLKLQQKIDELTKRVLAI
jgi:hypothetical protein